MLFHPNCSKQRGIRIKIKFEDKHENDFTKVKIAKEKTDVITGWIGEILYEALVYREPDTVKSLVEIIQIEIKDLIEQ